MRFQRNPLFFAVYIWQFFTVLDQFFSQFWIVRFFFSGVWFKSDDVWKQCDVLMVCQDGSYILRHEGVSFHETNLSVQALENHS